MIIVTGKNSSIWKEIKHSFHNKFTIFYDIKTASFYDDNNEEFNFDANFINEEVLVLNFASATPNNSINEDLSYFIKCNYLSILKLVEFLQIKYKIIKFFNVTTTAIFDRNSPDEIINLDSKKIDCNDNYGFSKLLLFNYLRDKKFDNLKSLQLVVPVLLGKYTSGNFLTKLILNGKLNEQVTISHVNSKFNSLFSVRALGIVLEKFISCEFNNLNNSTILFGCTHDPCTIKEILNVLKISKYNEVPYKYPPKLIDISSLINYYPDFKINTLKEIEFYAQFR